VSNREGDVHRIVTRRQTFDENLTRSRMRDVEIVHDLELAADLIEDETFHFVFAGPHICCVC
jgi:hypothetical protein